MTVQDAADALGLSVHSVYSLIDEGLLWGRKVPGYHGRPRWDIDPESVAAEKQRRAEGRPKPEPEPPRPVYLKLPENLCDVVGSLDPDAIAAYIRKLRREAVERQSVG